MRRAAAAAAAAGLQVPQISSWQEPPPKENPEEKDLAAGVAQARFWIPRRGFKAGLPWRAELCSVQLSAQEEVECSLHHCLHERGDLTDIMRCHKRCCLCWCSAVAPALLPALPAQCCSGAPTMTPEWGYVPLSQVFSLLGSARTAPTGKIPSGAGCRAPLPPLQLFVLSNPSCSPALPPLQAQL